MKKILAYSLVLTIIAVITISGTYAMFTASVTSDEQIDFDAHNLKVIYGGDIEITGYLELVRTKEEGFRRVVYIGLGEDSVDAQGKIYIYLEEISEGLASQALKWEIYEIGDEGENYLNSGTFLNTTSGEKVYLSDNIELTTTEKQYAIYLWLNGYEAGNEVRGASFRGFIGAESEIVTGDITEE